MVGKHLRLPRFNMTRQRGSAALIVTIAISLILVVLFVGATTIATRQIRESINSDNSNRALYAAEAGVEDAARRLAADPNFLEPTCNASATDATGRLASGQEMKVSNSGTAADVAWTCRTITQSAAELTGNLSKDESLELNLSRSANKLAPDSSSPAYALTRARYMTIEWNDPKVDSTTPYGVGAVAAVASSALPAYASPSDWGGRAAALEVTATWLPNTLSAAQFTAMGGVAPIRTILASPVNSGTQSVDFSPLNGGQGSCSGTATNNFSCWPVSGTQDPQGVTPGSLQSNGSVKCDNGSSLAFSCKFPSNAVTASGTSGKYDLRDIMKTEYDANYAAGNVSRPSVIQPDSVCHTPSAGDLAPDPADSTKNCVLFLRLKARYASTSYSIRFFDAAGQPVYVPDGYATIDVTARSNNYFRRVVAKKRISPSVYDGVFDNALFSGTTICKTMQVYKDFRGAPDHLQDVNGNSLADNPNAGKNASNCTE